METTRLTTRERSVAWAKDDPFGAEFARVELGPDSLRAGGVAIGSSPEPYRLDYQVGTGAGFITEEVLVSVEADGWTRRLELRRSGSGLWTADATQTGDPALSEAGGDLSLFGEALDPDLALSPLFNTMPVLRHSLHDGGVADDFLMVWISVPDLGLHPSHQRYTYLESRAMDQRVVRFEAVGGDFVADVVFDSDGLVVDYPGVATRIATRSWSDR